MKRNYENYEITEEIEELVSTILTCNKCAKEIETEDSEFTSFVNFKINNERIDLCEECLIEWIVSFKKAPIGFRIDYGYDGEDEKLSSSKEFKKFKNEYTKNSNNKKII